MRKTPRDQHNEVNFADKKIVFSVQQILTYSITCITIGASIYTLFKALPKIEALDAKFQELKESNVKVDQKITDLRDFIGLQRSTEEIVLPK